LSDDVVCFLAKKGEAAQLANACRRLGPDSSFLTASSVLQEEIDSAVTPEALLAELDGCEAPPIEFIDLHAQQDRIRPQLERAVHSLIHQCRFILGDEVARLEKELAAYVGVTHAITCASGTDALYMPLLAKGIGPGDLIFTTPFTFVATAEVISLAGATPVFVDIDPVTFNMDPVQLEQAITACLQADPSGYPLPAPLLSGERPWRCKGIIPVDLFGLPAAYDRITATANRHGLFVLEDAAQGFGGIYQGKKAGSLGGIGATSFFPAKPLGCYGDGGAIFTNDDGVAAALLSIRVHGQGKNKYDNIRIGVNGRMDALQAAILRPKLHLFDRELDLRQEVAGRYTERFAMAEGIRPPTVPDRSRSAWAQYSLVSDRREKILAHLREQGIPSAIYYPIPLHLQTAYSYLGYKKGDFPQAEDASNRIFSLPMHPYLQAREQEKVVAAVLQANSER